MYESPIDVTIRNCTREMQKRLESAVLSCCEGVEIKVNRDELLRALQYDRSQYEKGYEDGRRDSVRNAHWENATDCESPDDCPFPLYRCSGCHTSFNWKSKYCPECGAEMLKEIEK